MEKIAVEQNIWIDAPLQPVWVAITDPKVMGKWWPPDEWDIPVFEVDGGVRFGADADAAFATIQNVTSLRQFDLRWQANQQFPTANMVTSFLLSEENGGTRVSVTESGFEGLPADLQQVRANQTAEGYELVLQDLKTLLEKPEWQINS